MKESGLIKVNPNDYLDNGNGTAEPARCADYQDYQFEAFYPN
jgi:hypothetical protein